MRLREQTGIYLLIRQLMGRDRRTNETPFPDDLVSATA
jgi:hypothetical protein